MMKTTTLTAAPTYCANCKQEAGILYPAPDTDPTVIEAMATPPWVPGHVFEVRLICADCGGKPFPLVTGK